MIVLGIVGSPAGGKSTVAAILAELGGTWINADLVARDVLHRADVQTQLVAYFGPEIADEGGRIDRNRMASRVFGDDDLSRSALTYLESVIHPRTRGIIAEQLRNEFKNDPVGSVVLLDIPLLFEAGWDRSCDEIVCVDSSEVTRQERVRLRGWDADELRRREKNQLPIAEKKRLSTYVLENDAGLDELRTRVTNWYSRILQSSRASASRDSSIHSNC